MCPANQLNPRTPSQTRLVMSRSPAITSSLVADLTPYPVFCERDEVALHRSSEQKGGGTALNLISLRRSIPRIHLFTTQLTCHGIRSLRVSRSLHRCTPAKTSLSRSIAVWQKNTFHWTCSIWSLTSPPQPSRTVNYHPALRSLPLL